MKFFNRLTLVLLTVAVLSVPMPANAAAKSSAKAIGNQLKNLERQTEASQVQTLGLIDTVSDNLKKRLDTKRRQLQKDAGLKADLDVRKSRPADIEKTRKKLQRDIAEWTADIEYTEMKAVKQGVADALAVAEADHLNVEKLTNLYNMTKKIIRNAQFRSAGATMADKLQNLDLDRAETDRRLKALEAKRAALQKKLDETSYLNLWTRENLKMELAGVEFEILQHRMNVRHEDISKPMYIAMDGVFSGLTALTRLTAEGRKNVKKAGLEGHGFDWGAPRELAQNYVLKLVTLGFEGEAMAAEAAAARQKYRKNLYKRTAIAFIRALVSGRDACKPCAVNEMKPESVDYNSRKVTVLGCPDPVVENLRAYLDAIRKFQDAEADRAIAEAEQLVAEQQIIADFMAAVPLVSDAMDIYSIYAGENLAGVKLSGLERSLMGVMTALPLVGPHAFKQAMDRSEAFKSKMEAVGTFFTAVSRLADDVIGAMGAIKKTAPDEILKALAKKMDVEPAQLKQMILFWKEAPYVIDDAARSRMSLFRTMRDASEDRIAVHTLMGNAHLRGIYRRARQQSQDLLESGLRRSQGKAQYVSLMPEQHRRAFAEVAQKQRKVIAMRPVGQDAAKQLANNFAGTKGLNIKPKSANWGPQRAFIPVDQQFSKLGNPKRTIDWDEISKYRAKADACLRKPPCANTTALRVPLEGETDLVDVVVVKKGGRDVPVYRKNGGELVDPDTMTPIGTSELDSTEITPMEVFADANGNPLTADYDLLAVGSTRDIQAPHASRGAGYDPTTGRQAPRSAGDKGTLSKEMDEVVDELNKAGREKGGYTRGNLVHHGPETFNPSSEGVFTASELDDGLALTVFDPDYGELAIPACDEAYMKNWCRSTGMCNPDNVCSGGAAKGCIPIDPDRILKDYFHDARLRGIDISPHSAWNWGRYNGLGGWTQTGFLGVPAEVAESVTGSFSSVLQKSWQSKIASSLYRMFCAPAAASMGEKE